MKEQSLISQEGKPRNHSRRDFFKYSAGVAAGVPLLSVVEGQAEAFETELKPLETDCPVIDVHAHVSNSSRIAWIPDWIRMDHESMKRQQRAAGIQQSFISDSSLYPKPYYEDHLRSLCASDKSLKMWATYITWSGLYPPTKSRDEMIEAALKHGSVIGAKVDLVSGVSGRVGLEIVNHYIGEEPCVYFDLVRDGDPLFEICAAAGKPLMCHTDLSTSAHNAEQILTMAKRHSNVSVIICHIGLGLMYTHFAPASHLKELLKAKEADNVYVETSMYSFMWGGQVEGVAEELGSDRMLFGTDSPGKCAASWITRIQNAEMDEAHKKNIFHRTAEELFSLRSG